MPHQTPASTHSRFKADKAPERMTSSESYIHRRHSWTATMHREACRGDWQPRLNQLGRQREEDKGRKIQYRILSYHIIQCYIKSYKIVQYHILSNSIMRFYIIQLVTLQ